MDIQICQSCGAILKGPGKTCNACGAFISNFSPTVLPGMSGATTPLIVDVKPDVLGLERVVSKRQMTMVLEKNGNGNGHGNGNGNGNGNSQPQPTSIDIPGGPLTGGAQQGPANAPATNPWEQPLAQLAPPTPEPTELNFAAPQQQQGQQQSAPNNSFMQPPGQGQVLVETPSGQPVNGINAPFGGASGQQNPALQDPMQQNAMQQNSMQQNPMQQNLMQNPMQQNMGQGQTAPDGQFLPAPVDNSAALANPGAPPVQGGPADFFSSAPPSAQTAPIAPNGQPLGQAPPNQAQQQGQTMGQTVATAAVSAAVGAAVGVAAAKTFDFFNAPAQGAQPDGGAPPPTGQDASYSMGERSDFFASSGAPSAPPNSEAPPIAGAGAPPIPGELPPTVPTDGQAKPTSSQQNIPAADKHSFEHMVSGGAHSAPSEQEGPPGGFDFFAAAPMKESKKSSSFDENSLYPDETHLRGSKTRPVKDSPSSLSRYADDDEDVKPKIARPRGYTPKEGSSNSSKNESKNKDHDDHDQDHDDDDEDVTFYKDKPPARRSFSGNTTAPKKKSSDDDDDDDSSSKKVKKDGFLHQEVSLFGMSMTRQNQLMLISIFAFVGIVFFNMIGLLFGGFQMGPPPKPAVTSLPNLSGNWKVQYSEGPQETKHLMAVLAQQKGLDIQGRGSDEYGEFTITGTVIPPDRIQLKKKYKGQEDAKPVVFDGQFALGSDPLYSRGRWTLKHVVGKFLHATVREDGGGWEANYYVNDPSPVNGGGVSVAGATNPDPFQQMKLSFENLDMSKKLLFAAFGVVGVALVALFGSLIIFGPSGKMNVWEKQKYIPSQFKSQHNKIMKELSKPLKPGGLPLGRRNEWRAYTPWVPKDLSITPEIRENDPHLLILGAGDKGKTRLMATMIAHDIESADRAVVVIDSDGGLTDLITRWVSAHEKGKELSNRIVLLDPTYKNNSMGYNPLEMPDDEDLQSAASSLVYGFKAIYTEPPGAQSQWNQQTANILRNAALLLMVNGKTLTDLPALLNDNDFRDVLLESVEKRKKEKAEYITLLDTWGQYKRLARTDQWINWVEPILNRVGPMLSDSRIRSILTKPVGDIKLKSIIKEKKVLIVKVAKGQLDQNANLLGSLVVTGVKQAALSLANEVRAKQPPVALYLDEFDNFIEKDTIEAITSETDKFKIGFIGCIKTLQHLPEDFRNQLIIAVGTMACFALAKKDGDLLGPQMFRVDGRKIKHQTIQNFFNKVNTSPQFELISDEEKLNIDRVVGQEERTFFCYRVGTVAGVFNLRSHDFNDVPDSQVKKKIIDKMHGNIAERDPKKKEKDKDKDREKS